jgi:hypothetical protein
MKTNPILIALIVLLSLTVMLLLAPPRSSRAASADYLVSPDERLDRVPVAMSEAAWEEMAAASRDRSLPSVNPEGVFFRVPVPVRIRVIRFGVLEEIQIAEGPSAGRTGFVPFEWVTSRELPAETSNVQRPTSNIQ